MWAESALRARKALNPETTVRLYIGDLAQIRYTRGTLGREKI